MRYRLIIILALLGAHALADGLGAPTDFESTSILPKGIRNVKLLAFSTEILSKYDSGNSVNSLGTKFQKNVTYSDLYKGKPASEQALSKGYMQSMGIENPETTTFGYTTGYASARVTATVPVFAFGVSEKWTTAIAIPIVYTNTFVDTGFDVTPGGQAFFGKLAEDTNVNKAKAGLQKTSNPVAAQVAALGYEPLVGQSQTSLGDIRWINKYLISKNITRSFLIKQFVTLPTGKVANPNNLMSLSTGDGQWDVGAAAVADWYMAKRLSLTTHLDYTAQLPDHIAKRIPDSSDSTLSSDTDYKTYRNLGDLIGGSLALKYEPLETTTIGLGYSVQHKYGDRYRGGQYSQSRYDYLTSDTDQDMRAILAGINFSTIPLFRKKSFSVPLEAKINHTEVIAGRNVAADSITALDVSVYF
ncbi:MAG: hypothetical protein SGJ18_05125 [Pseudomonadota bacterium]|nr:hypothetical protein [Pseudomonadota bacterium]